MMTKNDAVADALFGGPDNGSIATIESERHDAGETTGRRDVNAEVADFLLSGEEPLTDELDDGAVNDQADSGEAVDETDKPDQKLDKAIPYHEPAKHDERLLAIASEWGISREEAANYPTDEALASVISSRERRFRLATASKATAEPARKDDEELTIPELDLEKVDFDDPQQARQAVKSLNDGLKKVADFARQALKNRDERIDELRRGYQGIADQNESVARARVMSAYDEEVSQWDDDLKEAIGIPTQTVKLTGSQGDMARKLMQDVALKQAGYAALNGVPDPDTQVRLTRQWVKEARYSLFPDAATKKARKEVADGLRNQRGGVATRPTEKTHDGSVPQGDRHAMRAIDQWFASQGLDAWGGQATKT